MQRRTASHPIAHGIQATQPSLGAPKDVPRSDRPTHSEQTRERSMLPSPANAGEGGGGRGHSLLRTTKKYSSAVSTKGRPGGPQANSRELSSPGTPKNSATMHRTSLGRVRNPQSPQHTLQHAKA